MIARTTSFVGFLILVAAAACGCGGKSTPAIEEATDYPVRADWLVVNVPTGVQPSSWYMPGYPPLVMLDRPHATLTGDDALLATQKRAIIDTRKLDPELRDEFGKVLNELYGTATEPRLPDGDKLIAELKLDQKLTAARAAFQAKQKEIADFKAAVKTPDDQQLVTVLEGQSPMLANDLRNLEDRIAGLKNYQSELHLDNATLREGGILYRNYCQQCHGLTGDGNGPGGKYLIPLPRDYRQGLFKFITTDPSVGGKRKPRREDLQRTITRGMEGSPMPQFAALSDYDVQALVSYVIHLSMRGETEYEVMKKAADPAADEFDRADVRKGLIEQSGGVIPIWLQSAKNPIVPDANPYPPEKWAESAANGFAIFNDTKVGCTTCHSGYGKSAPYSFDSWGSITRPRNLTIPVLRGGRNPEEIYARIYGGILGSNMPAHVQLRPSFEEKVKGNHKIWDLVHFIMYISESAKRQELKDRFQIEIDP